MSVDTRWYVVHTYSGYENKVKTNIEKVVENRNMHDEIFEVKIPTETVTEIVVLVKVAVHMDDDDRPAMNDETWLVIRNTRGVTGFVGPENKAIPLTEEEVYKLGVEKRSVEVSYEVGDLVTVIYGSFEGVSGIVDKIDVENDTVTVIISMMGRDTPLELGLDQVESAVD